MVIRVSEQNKFYIAGESYAGIYLPTLARRLIDGINAKTFPNPYFQGIAIGNGFMNARLQTNSALLWLNYHGAIGVDEWKTIKELCCKNQPDVDTCDFYGQMINELKQAKAENISACNDAVMPFYDLPGDYDPYNFYQDCYQTNTLRIAKQFYRKAMLAEVTPGNTAADLNYDSTDNQNGYPCWDGDALLKYLNSPAVMEAFHIDKQWIEGRKWLWRDCNDALFDQYVRVYRDTTPIFVDIINKVKIPRFRFLIYNGDLDTVCDFLGDAWHISALAHQLKMHSTKRVEWNFRGQVAGFVKRYYSSNITIDLLTVKGAGHFVPNDRPGPSLKMLTNFIRDSGDYSSTDGFDPLPSIHGNPTTSKATYSSTDGFDPLPSIHGNPTTSATTSTTSKAILSITSEATPLVTTYKLITAFTLLSSLFVSSLF